MPLVVRVQEKRGRPWELYSFKDEERDVATEFMDGQVAAGRRVKMDATGKKNQGGSERHRDGFCNRRPMRAAGCYPG